MLEVCFSDALKGGLTFALLEDKGAFLKNQQDILMPYRRSGRHRMGNMDSKRLGRRQNENFFLFRRIYDKIR